MTHRHGPRALPTEPNRLRAIVTTALAAVVFAFVLSAPRDGRAQNLVSDLSNHLVAITSDFTGAEVLLFGTIATEGDIVVTIAGPRQPVVVRRKDRVAGIWMNTESVEFQSVPAFYAVASTAPIDEIASDDVQDRQEMGVEHLSLKPQADHGLHVAALKEFREGLIRNKVRQRLYEPEVQSIQLLSDRLFRTTVALPSNPTEGTYTVSVYMLQNGTVVEAQTNPLIVSKTGISADVFLFAHDQPALYGILAIIVAIGAGWLAAVIFRKV